MRGNRNQFIKEGDEFTCECGRKFTSSQSLYAHQSHCKIHLGDRYDPDKHKGWNVGDVRAWHRGRTVDDPIYGESIKRSVKAMASAYNPGMTGHHQSAESRLKQSETRKRKYLSGELLPAKGVGRGKYSYLIYNDKRIMLRSTYEFIYALYLLYHDIEFEYESVRVKSVTDYKYASSFISDFLIGNTIVEIKGFKTSKVDHAKKAFESAGYAYKLKTWDDITECYDYLKSKIDIDNILESIKVGHDSKQYYEYTYSSSPY
jgi:hypothetical protein